MKYIRAYFKAFWELFCAASAIYIAMSVLLYVFTPWHISNLVGFYLFYLVALASVGGVVKEMVDK